MLYTVRAKMNQYWSLSWPVLLGGVYQYCSEVRPVLLDRVTSTGSNFRVLLKPAISLR